MSTLELRNVGKTFPNNAVAVRGVDLVVADGEFVAIVGPSGCGKTTVLRMVAGLEDTTSGDILIDGELVNDQTPQQRDIAMAFQQHALYPHMTVFQNLGFSLSNMRLRKREIERRVSEMAKLLGLADVLDERPGRLSGGQQQRVGLGRAIIRNPRLFLMDEPMSNLDAKLRTSGRAEILRIHERLGTTTLYVTHDQVEAMAMAHRIVVMRDGHVVQIGSPLDVYNRPADVFVGQFIGAPPMSVIRGVIVERGPGDADNAGGADNDGAPECVVAVGNHHIPFASTALAFEHIGRPVAVGLRPESLQLDPAGSLVASVEFAEQLGAQQLVHVSLDCPGVAMVGNEVVNESATHAKATMYVDANDHVSLWKPVPIAVDPSLVHLFDVTTGRRLDELQRAPISTSQAGSRVGRPPLVVQPCTVTPVACATGASPAPTVTR